MSGKFHEKGGSTLNKNFSTKHALCVLGLSLLLVFLFTGFGSSVKAKADETVRMNVSETAIAKDGVFRLRIYNAPKNAKIIYRSSDTSVAYVDNRGYITGISNGECVVTATVVIGGSPSETLKCNVTVGPSAISIKLTKSEIVLSVGMKKTLKTIISPLNTVEKPVFYSSDTSIASVTTIGRVRAKSVGEVEIFAFLLNGESAECTVYVLEEDDYKKYSETGTLVGIIEGYSETDETAKTDKDGKDDNQAGENTETTEPDETVTPTEEPAKEQTLDAAKEADGNEKTVK